MLMIIRFYYMTKVSEKCQTAKIFDEYGLRLPKIQIIICLLG
jgi:hypothetical protein